jgi:hypothetical protein
MNPVNPVDTLRAAVKGRRARVREQVHYSDDFDDPMTVEAKFTHDGRPLIVRASNSRFEIDTRIETALIFSVGAPNRWGATEPVGVVTGTGIPLFGTTNLTTAASRETLLAWIAEPAHQALFERLRLQSSEAVHVRLDRVWAVVRGGRVLDDSLFGIVVSLATALETVPPPPAPPEPPERPEEPFDGPPELGAFLREFGHLAEGDDVLRSELAEQLSKTERAKFIRRVNPLFAAINAYLDSRKGPWPDHAITLGQLGELGSELSLLNPESPENPVNAAMMTPDAFASAMTDRFREILPAGVEVWADGAQVWFGQSGKRESGTSVGIVGADQANYHGSVLEIAANNVLNHGQDYVVMCIRERWPPFTRADGGIGMASYYARLDGNVLRMGYGSEEDPVLELRPLVIED